MTSQFCQIMSSHSQRHVDPEHDAPPLGSRENFWGETISGGDRDGGHAELEGTDRLEWIAYSILKETAPQLCPECGQYLAGETDNEGVGELSDPEHYVPRSRVQLDDGITITLHADHRRERHCKICGRIGGGLICDQTEAEFLNIVSSVLHEADVPPSRHQDLYSAARARKQRGFSDTRNLRETLYEIEHGVEN